MRSRNHLVGATLVQHADQQCSPMPVLSALGGVLRAVSPISGGGVLSDCHLMRPIHELWPCEIEMSSFSFAAFLSSIVQGAWMW